MDLMQYSSIQHIKDNQQRKTNCHCYQASNKRQPDEVTEADVLVAPFEKTIDLYLPFSRSMVLQFIY